MADFSYITVERLLHYLYHNQTSLQHLWGGLVRLEQQRGPRFQERPQLDLVFPADGELGVAQGEDLVDGVIAHQVVPEFLCNQKRMSLVKRVISWSDSPLLRKVRLHGC